MIVTERGEEEDLEGVKGSTNMSSSGVKKGVERT